MNSIILCEGNDDLWMIGYFLHKACNNSWNYSPDKKISDNFKLPKDTRREKAEVYTNGVDNVVVYAVGGKDCFKKAIHFVLKINSRYPEERFQQIVIVRDRDNDSVEMVLNNFQQFFEDFEESDYKLQQDIVLKDKENITLNYIYRENSYSFNVATIIIPFDCEGCLETILINSISKKGEEERYICESAKSYIDSYLSNYQNHQYITKQREDIKAKFSSVISIINPTMSTKVMNDVLMEFEWEKSPYICENFRLLKDLFS